MLNIHNIYNIICCYYVFIYIQDILFNKIININLNNFFKFYTNLFLYLVPSYIPVSEFSF